MASKTSLALAAMAAALTLIAVTTIVTLPNGRAQQPVDILSPDEARAQLENATRASEQAEARAARLAAEAEVASEAADRAAREAAALAAQRRSHEETLAMLDVLLSAPKARFSRFFAEADMRLDYLEPALRDPDG
ncbi:MAG: metalloendopeptidase, partial [Pseudomonadota bacterium]